jgi:hypothetical protein
MATCRDGWADDRPDDRLANQIEREMTIRTGNRSFLEDGIACVCIENKGG